MTYLVNTTSEEAVTEFIIKQQLMIQDFVEQMFVREEGQGMIEYALLAALISIAAIAVITLIGPKLVTIFTSVSTAL